MIDDIENVLNEAAGAPPVEKPLPQKPSAPEVNLPAATVRQGNQIFASEQHEAMSRDQYAKKEFGIDIPVDAVPLPSGGLVYPEGHPLKDAKRVEYMAMTAREEDILMSQAFIKNGTVITKLIESCLVNKHIQVNSLLSGDRTALMVAIRVSGYGAQYIPEFKCPACGFNNKLSIDLTDLDIKSLGIEPVEPGQNLFSYILPISKKEVLFRFLTGAEEEAAAQAADIRQKKGILQSSLVTSRLASSIVSLDGITSKGEILRRVEALRAGDSRRLIQYIDKHEPGVEMKVDFNCGNGTCDHYGQIQLPMTTEFFWPQFGE